MNSKQAPRVQGIPWNSRELAGIVETIPESSEEFVRFRGSCVLGTHDPVSIKEIARILCLVDPGRKDLGPRGPHGAPHGGPSFFSPQFFQ